MVHEDTIRVYQHTVPKNNGMMQRMVRLAVWLMLCVGLASSQDELLVKLYTEARAAESAGDYKTATQRYERILALRPGMAEAHANLGNLYYVQGQWEQAGASFKKAVRLKPSLAAPHFFLGVLAFNARDFEHASTYLKKAESLDPANPLAPLYLGYTYYVQARYPEAASFLEKVTQVDEGNQDAWYHVSKLHGQLSKQYFDGLQKQHPDSFYTALARSHFYESVASWEQAGQELAKAAAMQPGNDSLKQRMEWLTRRTAGETPSPPPESPFSGSTRYLYAPPDGAKIRDAFGAESARAAGFRGDKSGSPEGLYEMAEAHQALSFLASLWVLQTNPDSYRAHELRGESLEAAGQTDEAVAEYRRALELRPELQTVHFTIGNLYWRRGRLDEALAELNEELKVGPNDPQTHYEIGDILFTQNKPEEAEKHFLQALKFSPDLTEAHLAVERIATARGDTAKALLHLKRVSEISPADPTPHYRMWLLYRKMGRAADAQQARATFEKLKAQEKK